MRALALLFLAILIAPPARAQWTLQQSHTTASLRGIHALGNGIAWASGTSGTVLHTTDDGVTWQTCTTPPGAAKLDFRGIQAFDANTAIVLSSGKGDLSRLYKTTDACKTWRLLLTNPDQEGFWDALRFDSASTSKHEDPAHNQCFGVVLGDPVDNAFVLLLTYDCGEHWQRQVRQSAPIAKDESIFAASNSSLILDGLSTRIFVTGGLAGPHIFFHTVGSDDRNALGPQYPLFGVSPRFGPRSWSFAALPRVKPPTDSSGGFSIATAPVTAAKERFAPTVIVGGNYKLPAATQDTAWYLDPQHRWHTAQTPPHGYRSAVAYDPETKTWITVGPNGTDISTDEGKNWSAVKPSDREPPDSDQNWNALSLPFVVGPKGRIGKLNLTAPPTP